MSTVLWIVQVLWGVFFSVTGFGKVSCYNPVLWNQALHEVPWLSAVPQDLFIFIGVCEFLGGVGLLLPDRRIHRVWTVVCEAPSARVDQHLPRT